MTFAKCLESLIPTLIRKVSWAQVKKILRKTDPRSDSHTSPIHSIFKWEAK